MSGERTMVTQLADDLLLTLNSITTGTNVAQTGGYGQHTLYVLYSPDTSNTNAMELTIELSPDGSNWFPYTGEYSAAQGTITPGTQVTLSFASAGITDQAEDPYFFVGSAQAIRIKVKETNTPGNYGNFSAWLLSTQP